MTKEDKKILEDAAKAARETADQAHQAAADADGADEALNKVADDLEEAAVKAQADSDAAVVDGDTPPAPKTGEEEDEEDNEDIDFEEELQTIEGQPPTPTPGPKPDLEKAKRALFFNAENVRKLGGDPVEVLGGNPPAPVILPPTVVPPVEGMATKDDLAEMEAAKLARTDAERKVIMYKYRTAIKPTGNIVEDVQNAYMLAHKGRIQRSFEEIRRGSFARPAPGTSPGRRPPVKPVAVVPQATALEEASMKRRGFVKQDDGSYVGRKYRVYFKPGAGWVEEPLKKK